MHKISTSARTRNKKHFPFSRAYPYLACFSSVNIRETSIHKSVVVTGSHCACVFSVFLCLFYMCEHSSFMLVLVLVLISQELTRLKWAQCCKKTIFRPSQFPRGGGGGVLPYSLGGGVPLGSRKSYPLPD